MKTYRCKHAVEAMRWADTDENREAFATWFDAHDVLFETRGSVVVLPGLRRGADHDEENAAAEGEWIVLTDSECLSFVVMTDGEFTAAYEAFA